MRIGPRNERGAVAVMVALLAVVLLSVSAMSVDLGNAWAQKRQVQAGGDLATEAGAGIKGDNLPKVGSVKTCSYGAAGALATDQSVKDITSYLPGQLTDCSMTNGEVVYGLPTYNNTTKAWSVAFNKNQLSLVTPPKTVDFG